MGREKRDVKYFVADRPDITEESYFTRCGGRSVRELGKHKVISTWLGEIILPL